MRLAMRMAFTLLASRRTGIELRTGAGEGAARSGGREGFASRFAGGHRRPSMTFGILTMRNAATIVPAKLKGRPAEREEQTGYCGAVVGDTSKPIHWRQSHAGCHPVFF